MRLVIDNTPTRASIAASYAAMLADRRLVEQQIGVSITDSGRLRIPVTVHCHFCARALTARDLSQVDAVLVQHCLVHHNPISTHGAA